MATKQHQGKSIEKTMHDVRSHLSVILSALELAILDEATITREDALAAIKSTVEEVNAITKLLK